MDSKIDTANLQPLSLLEMLQLEGGAVIPWAGIFIAVGAATLTNLPDMVKGFIDGWKACR
ncbi:MAG TPA: hypothetical protein VK470_10780 [Bacteroidota bacterium]|nr:hypothetical protein [Bacteroidota bacterium]